SMGGMIVQQMAIDSSERLLSMTSIMSTTSEPGLPEASGEALKVLTEPPPPRDDIEALIDHTLRNRKVVGGDGFSDGPEARAQTRAIIERQFYPAGTARQRGAVMASGPRTKALKSINVPTLVIHGDKDSLVPVEGGIHTAETIPGARLEILKGMGHAQFPMYQQQVIGLIIEHVNSNSAEI
ncbi:MAG: alpha/beta hydrolase, partial [Pseudomonadota bacterium]